MQGNNSEYGLPYLATCHVTSLLFKSACVNKHLARCFDERLPKYLFFDEACTEE